MRLQLLTLCLLSALFACKKDKNNEITPARGSKDTIVNEYVTIKANGVVEINSLPYPQISTLKYNLFSFDSMALVGNVEDSIHTAAWDIAFKGNGTTFSPNWGGTAPDYGDAVTKFAGNPSDVSCITYTDTTFDAITAAPPAAVLIHSLSVNVTNTVYDNETGELKYIGFPKGVVTVLKLNDGRYVKFQFVSIYKNAPDTITPEIYQNDIRYFTFRYFVSKKGSTDLSTK